MERVNFERIACSSRLLFDCYRSLPTIAWCRNTWRRRQTSSRTKRVVDRSLSYNCSTQLRRKSLRRNPVEDTKRPPDAPAHWTKDRAFVSYTYYFYFWRTYVGLCHVFINYDRTILTLLQLPLQSANEISQHIWAEGDVKTSLKAIELSYALLGKKWIVIVIIVYYCLLLNVALLLSVGLLRPHVSGMTLCWPFNTHYVELSYVLCSYCWCGLMNWINKINE